MNRDELTKDPGFAQVVETYGDEDFAMEIINQVAEDTLKNLDLMKECVEKGEFSDYAVYAHGIKGMMATVYQEELRERSLNHEMAGKEGRSDYIKDDFAAYDAAMREFCGRIMN